MNKKDLHILEAAQGCEDTIKKRVIAAIAFTVIGIASGMFTWAAALPAVLLAALVVLIMVPACAVPYRIASIAAGRKVYLEDGDYLIVPSRLFGWGAIIVLFCLFGFVVDSFGKYLPEGPMGELIVFGICFVAGGYWLYRDIKTILAARKIEAAYFATDNTKTEQASPQEAEKTDFFAGCNDAISIKERYRSLMKIYHPDMQNGDTSFAKVINQQFEEQSAKYKQ